MSSDKDKRPSKLFGSRISSIFNVQQVHNVKQGNVDKHGNSTLSNVPVKPLSHTHLHNNPGDSIQNPHKLLPSGNIPPQSPVPLVSQTRVKSPPKRKPPPPLVDEFERRMDKDLAAESMINKRPIVSANRHGEEVKEDLNNIIGTLEKEIDSMLVTDEQTTHSDNYLHNVESEASPASSTDVTNLLNLSKSNQSGASYYSDCSQSLHESPKSLSISQSMSHPRKGSLEDTPTPILTPNDNPDCNPHGVGQIPYPVKSSLPLSPESPTFENNIADASLAMESDYKHNVSNDSRTSINSSVYSQNDAEPNLLLKSLDVFGSSQSIPSQRKKEYQAASSLNNTMNSGPMSRPPQNTPFIRGMQQNRNPLNPVPLEPISSDSNSRTKPPARQNVSYHRKSSSLSSIWSANSYRSVNMSKLKKSLDLKPGEGERSNYVVSIRRNAGTAYNEFPPGRWKLPIGILPVDNRLGYTANGRYLKLAGGIAQGRNKKTSGVELKHGHLQPRLLAAEVDDGVESPVGLQSLDRSGTDLTISTNKSLISGVKSSDSSINVLPNLLRNSSYGKTINDDLRSINTGGDSSSTLPSSKRAVSVSSSSPSSSSSSSSSNSITDFNIGIGGYYQHPGYLHNDDDEETSTEFEADNMDGEGRNRNNDFNDYDTKPRLVLANPDNSDDSD